MGGLTPTEIEPIQNLDEAHDFDIACDYTKQFRASKKAPSLHDVAGGGDSPARWIVFYACHCGHRNLGFACDACKDYIMATPECCICAGCGEVHFPYRLMVSRVEPLEKGAA